MVMARCGFAVLPRAAGAPVRSAATVSAGTSRRTGAVVLSLFLLAATTRAQQPRRGDSYLLRLGEAVVAEVTSPPRMARVPFLFIRTSGEYPCKVRLPVHNRVQGHRVLIEIGDIPARTHVCFAESGPATGGADLDLPDGGYGLEVTNGGRSDHYTLIVSASKVTVGPGHGAFTAFMNRAVDVTGLTKR